MSKTHLGLLCDIGELSATLAGSADLEVFLRQLVRIVAKHLRADVSSIYLYNEKSDELVLRENVGLGDAAKEMVRLKPSEGLVGLAFIEGRPVLENDASQHPKFKHFAGIDEERFECFLAVPIIRGAERVGVLVVQRRTAFRFDAHDTMALRATASQLAGAIENVRILMALRGDAPTPVPIAEATCVQLHLSCRVASEGLAVGPCYTVTDELGDSLYRDRVIAGDFSPEDFDRAALVTEEQLEDLQSRLEKRLPEVASLIFSAHILMLKDRNFIDRMRQLIADGMTPPEAILSVARRYIDIFRASDNAYIREKVQDVEDLAKRLIGNLIHKVESPASDCGDCIVIASELYPSDILKLASENAAGIILVGGGVTSHVSILASSLDIPMLIADDKRLLKLPDGLTILLDAEAGDLYVDPPEQIISDFRERQEAHEAIESAMDSMTPTTCLADGTRIKLLANINLLSEVPLARRAHAEGIGLYRTEFPFLVRPDFPSEEEQMVIYDALASEMGDTELTFRTLDVGGDKILPFFNDAAREENPILGMRSIRFSQRYPEVFRQQLRAILRAAADTKRLRIMFPMISALDEFCLARDEVLACIADLNARGVPCHQAPKIGMMVEIPSVVHIIDDLAAEADFFCIGTNDFIQFMLAVDRTNEKVASYFDPGHPAVLRALRIVAEAAERHGVDLSICGEMAHEVEHIPFLIGIGIRRLSVNPRYLPRVQRQLATLTVAQAEATAATRLAPRAKRATAPDLVSADSPA